VATERAGYSRSKISARVREYYNDLLRWPALVNAWRWRLQLQLLGARRPAPILVNLGCGKDYRPAYINIDVNLWFTSDMWLDLRNRLPFGDATVDGIFTSHVLEHFPLSDTAHIVAECHRVLRPGGVIRVVVPDVEPAIRAYVNGEIGYFHGAGASLGRRFSDHVLDNSNHRLIFDFSFMEELLRGAGFRDIVRCQAHQGTAPLSARMAELDNRPEISLYVEARR
jgi:predicted SAM-dependent methyltransferase